jgi:outer membrane protein assembly factor BamD
LALGNAGCLFQHHANTNPLASVKSEQPDKVLYDIAMADLDKGKYTVARLNLETLLNTYPDSEYLARAKMAIGDSWYRQGGAEGYAQAEAQYKDFITFFPAMKEASEAQLKIAEIHYKQLQKPDRDPTEAQAAESALRTFLTTYPTSPLKPQAVQMLRDTQEVLAERIFRIGQFYLERAQQGEQTDYRAAQSRLEEVINKYPLYSQGDVVLSELAHSYLTTSALYAGAQRFEPVVSTRGLYTANAKADQNKAIADFARLIRRYPLSPYAADAKAQLTALHAPVPTPTASEIAFNKAEIEGRGKAAKSQGFLDQLGLSGLISTHPTTEIARADKVGNPTLSQPPEPGYTPPPGLAALVRESMVASGALPKGSTAPLPFNFGDGNGSATLTAELTEADPSTAATDPPASGSNASASNDNAAPLAFQNIPQKPQGADTPDNGSPQAISGSNNNDPNARRETQTAASSNVILTPDEIDLEHKDEILASDVRRSVPPPEKELVKALKQRGALKKTAAPAAEAKPAAAKPGNPLSTAPIPTAPKKKSFWGHLWP